MATRPQRVAIFGAGIAGLTVAHELVRRGYDVSLFETNPDAGGFFRSARDEKGHMPSEYSWHGMGPWYHNAFAVLKQVPFDQHASVYDKGLSRPVYFGLVPDDPNSTFTKATFSTSRKVFRFTRLDFLRWGWMMLRTWTARRRSDRHFAAMNASQAFRPVLSDLGWRTWRSCFGPWVGSDWTNVSLHQVGLFFRKELFTRPAHEHPADEQGPAWRHGARDGWLLMRGPSSEFWFDKWVKDLEARGARFSFGETLQKLDYDGTLITKAHLESGREIDADVYVLATTPFAAADILDRTPALVGLDQLSSFRPLVADGPHTQVSFRIAFGKRIEWPGERLAVVVTDSEYNLTLFAVEQVWRGEVDLGDGVESLWTGTACVSTRPGRVHGLPLERCTKEQFIEEIVAQLAGCGGLDRMIQQANGGKRWRDFPIVNISVWHEWMFSRDGIRTKQPKWVNTTNTQPWLPTQRTPVPNLLLAGAHTRTDADVWSIEGAVESGRRAAQILEPDIEVIAVWVPPLLRLFHWIDDRLFALGAPHVLDLMWFAAMVGLAALVLVEAIWR